MGAKTPGVEGISLVDQGEAQGDGSDGEGRLGASLRWMELGGGWLMEEESQRGGRVLPQGLQSRRASCIE